VPMGSQKGADMAMDMAIPEDDLRPLARREARGMRHNWSHIKGLSTIVRVLPPDLYDKVMTGHEPLPAGSSIFGPIPSRRKMS
jgi:manganese oxidase